jgi:uridylate kinase
VLGIRRFDRKDPRVPSYDRVLLKLSGEAFAGGGTMGVAPETVRGIAVNIAEVVRDGTQVAVVVGGGNYFRGAELTEQGLERSRAVSGDKIGTLVSSGGTSGKALT